MYQQRRSRPPKRSARVRCRRGSETSSGHSSCSSSEVSSYRSVLHSDSGMSCMDLGSIAEHVFEDLNIHGHPSDTDTTETATYISDAFNANADKLSTQINDISAFQNGGDGAAGFVLNFNVSSAEDTSLYELFRQVLDWLDPELDLFQPQSVPVSDTSKDKGYYSVSTLDIPSLAIVLFLQEDGTDADSRAKQAKAFFNTRPWKVHHSEWVGGTVQMYPENSHDYYILTPDRPLCSVRQIHCGSEHLRVMRYVTSKHWKETIEFYRLILGQHSTVLKKDFCLFTVSHFANYDLQFALKKLPRGTVPKKTRKTELCFFISNIGSLVPLFPHPCHKISDVTWVTRDLDGNKIYLQVQPTKLQKRCRSVSPSKLMARTNRSAFSPVVPHKSRPNDDNGVQYAGGASMSLMDKLSPRVYVTRKANKSSIPLRPPSSSSRTSDSSAGLSSESCDLYNSAFSHDHTDSGFVDERPDGVRCDPRRTPIIGTHLSKFTQYDRYISTPDGEICLADASQEKEDLTPRSVAQPRGMSVESLAWVERYVESQNQRIHRIAASSPALSPRVTPTNRMPSPCLTPTNRMASPCLTPTNRFASPCVTPTNIPQTANVKDGSSHVDKTTTDNTCDVTETCVAQMHDASTKRENATGSNSGSSRIPRTCDICTKPLANDTIMCSCGTDSSQLTTHSLRTGLTSPYTVHPYKSASNIEGHRHSNTVEKLSECTESVASTPEDVANKNKKQNLNDPDLLTPGCASVDPEMHDLHEYMMLRWDMNTPAAAAAKPQKDALSASTAVSRSNASETDKPISDTHEAKPSAFQRLFGGAVKDRASLQRSQGKPPLPPTKTMNRLARSSGYNGECQYVNISNKSQGLQSSAHGQGHQSRTHGQGLQSTSTHGQGHQSSIHGQGHQSSTHGQGHQSSTHGQGHQSTSTHGQGHQSSSHDQGHQSTSTHGQGHQSNTPGQDPQTRHSSEMRQEGDLPQGTPVSQLPGYNAASRRHSPDVDKTLEEPIKASPQEVHNTNRDPQPNEQAKPYSLKNSNSIQSVIHKFESLSGQDSASQDKPQTVSKNSNAYTTEAKQNALNSIVSSTHSKQGQNHVRESDPTLGQFLSENKSVSECILKRSPTNSPNHEEMNMTPDYVNLPDLVKRNGFSNGQIDMKVNENTNNTGPPKTTALIVKEGTPEDLRSSTEDSRSRYNSVASDVSTVTKNSVFHENEASLQSCISRQSNRPKKRVRISEVNNTHHMYEAGQEHGFELADIYDENGDDFEENESDMGDNQGSELDADDVIQGCYNLKSGISTMYDTKNGEYSVRSTTENATPNHVSSTAVKTGSLNKDSTGPDGHVSNGPNSGCDWQKIKQCPDVGFYI